MSGGQTSQWIWHGCEAGAYGSILKRTKTVIRETIETVPSSIVELYIQRICLTLSLKLRHPFALLQARRAVVAGTTLGFFFPAFANLYRNSAPNTVAMTFTNTRNMRDFTGMGTFSPL